MDHKKVKVKQSKDIDYGEDCKVVQGLRFRFSHLGRGPCTCWSEDMGKTRLFKVNSKSEAAAESDAVVACVYRLGPNQCNLVGEHRERQG
jgi:hypothetical protein